MLDVGETLLDESRTWRIWADELGISHMEFMSVFGAVVARGQGYGDVADYFPSVEWASKRSAIFDRVGGLTEADIFPDVWSSLDRLRTQGYRLGIVGNQPRSIGAQLRALGVEAEVMVMSAEMGVMKPDPEFFRVTLELLGDTEPEDVAYVGDRIDNDVIPASAAGMRAIWLRRGPWGIVPRVEPPEADLIVDSLGELAERIDQAWR